MKMRILYSFALCLPAALSSEQIHDNLGSYSHYLDNEKSYIYNSGLGSNAKNTGAKEEATNNKEEEVKTFKRDVENEDADSQINPYYPLVDPSWLLADFYQNQDVYKRHAYPDLNGPPPSTIGKV